jgi:hypothetical protein
MASEGVFLLAIQFIFPLDNFENPATGLFISIDYNVISRKDTFFSGFIAIKLLSLKDSVNIVFNI